MVWWFGGLALVVWWFGLICDLGLGWVDLGFGFSYLDVDCVFLYCG